MVWFNTFESPWWGPAGFGFLGGVQVPEEVAGAPAKGETAVKDGSRTQRQSVFSPYNPMYGPVVEGIDAWPSSINGARDSNGSNPLQALLRSTRKIASNYFSYRKMRADGVVAIGREIADALVSTNQWTYEAADESVPTEWVEHVQTMWEGRGIEGESHEGFSLREYFLTESCRAHDYGNHTLEVAYGEDDDGMTVIDEFLPLLPENTRPLVYTGTRKFAGVRNYGISGNEVDLEPEYCVRFIYDSEGGDLFGRSRFENCKDWIQLKWDIRDKIRTDLNISIGNIMTVGYPMDDTGDAGKTALNEAKARTIGISLAKGLTVTVPGHSLKNQMAMAQAGIDPAKVKAWDINRLDTGTNSFDGFKIATDLVDEQILFGMLCLPRAVREADHGAKADAEQHTDSMSTMSWKRIIYSAGLAQNKTDIVLMQCYGPEARGKVKIKPTPIDDETIAVLKAIYTVLLSDKALALKMLDVKADAEKLKLKLNPNFDQDKLVKQMDAESAREDLSSSERLRHLGYDEDGIKRVKKERAEDDAIPKDDDGLGDN